MKKAICKLKSISVYSQSKYVAEPKKNKESHADYEERTWRHKMHFNDDGMVYIPPMAFANCIKEAAKFLSISVPGGGKATYTKHFEAGVMVVDELDIGINKDDVLGQWQHVPSDGQRGGKKRVMKCFPVIPEWMGEITFHIADDKITKDVFLNVLREAGQLIGIGYFRPRNCGFWGRFEVLDFDWHEPDYA